MYFNLLGVFFKQQFSLQRLFGQNVAQSVWKRWLLIGLLVYAMAVSVGGNLYLYVDIAQGLQSVGQLDSLLLILFTNVSSVAIFLTLFQASGYVFAYKDFETLAPLPIPHWQVIAAKISMMHIFVLLFSLLLNGPILGVYFYYAQLPILAMMVSIIFYAFIPIPMMAVVSMISWVIHQTATRFVNKSVMQIILMLVFLAGYLVISFSSLSEDLVSLFEPFNAFLNAYYQPAVWFQSSITQLNVESMILFLGLHMLVIILFIVIMTPLSRYSNLNQSNIKVHSRGHINKQYQSKPFFWSLFFKEWRYYFSIPIYFINTAFGLILLVGGSLGLWFFKDQFISSLGLLALPVDLIIVIVIGFSLSTVYTPSISLSLEGSNFSVLKSLPIEGRTVMLSKVLFNISLVLVPLAFSLVIVFFAHLVNLDSLLLIGLNAILFSVLTSLINGVINLIFPKFEFQNEVEVVKQSLGAFLGVFSGLGVMVLFGALMMVMPFTDNALMLTSLAFIQMLFVVLLVWFYVRQGNRLFSKLY